MQRVDLHVELRTKTGKGAARSLRQAGRIPAVVYGGDSPAQPIDLDRRELWQILHVAKGEHVLINMYFGQENDAETLTLLKEMQQDPVRGDVEHVDFQRVSVDRPIYTTIPIRAVGTSVGVKEGGVLEHLLRELDVECLPLEIPDAVEVDVSDLKIGQSLHVSDLSIPGRSRVLANPESVVVLVAAPTKAMEMAEAAVTEEAEAEKEEGAAETSEATDETTQ